MSEQRYTLPSGKAWIIVGDSPLSELAYTLTKKRDIEDALKEAMKLLWEKENEELQAALAGVIASAAEKKVVDLSVLIESGIDCDFWDLCYEDLMEIGKLAEITSSYAAPYVKAGHASTFEACRPRMNHPHAWQGGDCPLPVGFEVRITQRCGFQRTSSMGVTGYRWVHEGKGHDIIAFEVLGLADGWVMPWEKDNE